MTTSLPYLGVAKAAAITNVRLTLGAMGLGFGGLGVPMVAKTDDTATSATEPTGYMQYDGSADSDLVATLQALVDGDVPGLDINGNPILWGQDGVISQVDAIAAFGTENVQVISAAGVPAALLQTWRDENISALGYKLRPEDL
jgi:hypothetical protein